MRALIAAALIAAAPAAMVAAPAAAATPEAKHPDFSGFWSAPLQVKPDPAMMAKLPPNTVFVDDTGGAEFPKGEYGGLKLTPEAAKIAADWKAEDEMTLSRTCLPPSVVYSTQGPFPMEIYQTRDLIVFKHEYFDQVRLVFMDGRKHPPEDAPHSKVGFSTGKWEGDELVVETTHLEPSTITNNGLFHSDKVRIVERFKLSPDGKTLKATQWFSDPEMLQNNGVRYIEWKSKPGQYVYPYECDPSFATNYQAR